MKIIKLKCKCGKEFDRELREYRRQIKNGNNTFYCTLSCSGRYGKGFEYFEKWRNSEENKKHLKSIGSRRDEYSPYREHLRRVRNRVRDKGISYNISLEYLKEIFESQKGKCIYTGINLIHPLNMVQKDYIYMASVDRIDSNKGYEIGNIQFISACMNYAKNNMSHKKAKEFIEVIRNGNGL